MTSIDRNSIRQTVRARSDEIVELARTLIRFPTLSPPGRNTSEIQGTIARYLGDAGFEIDQFEVYPGDPDVVGTRRAAIQDSTRR